MKELAYYQDLYDQGYSLDRICAADPEAKRMFLQKNLTFRSRSQANKLVPGRQWSAADKEKHSKKMHQVVKENPDSYNLENVCRRVKNVEYNGVLFHSSWEAIFAKFLDENKINWERKVQPVEYILDSRPHLYFPDFYLPDFDTFVEVKGYVVNKDRVKWEQFKGRLLLIQEKEMKQISKRKYNIFADLILLGCKL